MKPRRYPLESLRDLRQGAVDARTREVAETRARAARAEQAESVARQQREQAENAARLVLERERAQVETEGGRAVDLQRAGAFRVAEERRVATLAEQERRRAAETAERRREDRAARDRLARAESEAKAVDKHRDGWVAERAHEQEASEEEAGQEIWQARRSPRGGSER